MKKVDAKAFESLYEGSNMEELINKLVKDLKNDAEIYELLKPLNLTMKEVRENIAKLTDFKDDYHVCKNCPGIDKCYKATPHVKMNLIKDCGYLSSSYEPCDKILEKIRLDNQYLFYDCPIEWRDSSLRNLDLSLVRKQIIKDFAKIIDGESKRWLFVKGKHKTGKSFTLVTFANEFARLNKGQVAIVNCASMFKDLADLSYQNKEEFTRKIVALNNVDLLLLDNFGSEYKNEYLRDFIVIPLLLDREKNSRLTFFTSDFSIKEIKELYSIGKNAGEIRAKQLSNILETMCEKEYDFNGVSLYK